MCEKKNLQRAFAELQKAVDYRDAVWKQVGSDSHGKKAMDLEVQVTRVRAMQSMLVTLHPELRPQVYRITGNY